MKKSLYPYYDNTFKKKFLNELLSFILVLSLFVISYIYSYIILVGIDLVNRNFLENHFYSLRIIITTIMTSVSLFLFYKKNKFIESISKLLLLIFTCNFSSGLLAYLFGNNTFWIFKYSIGIIVGFLFYFIYKKENNTKTHILAGITSLLSLFLVENIEYFLNMDPPKNPSILYIKSFSNTILWFATIGLVFVSAYMFSKGILINKIKKHQL
jgi:hypothetical protein